MLQVRVESGVNWQSAPVRCGEKLRGGAWCLKKARLFRLGCPHLTMVVDHRPLVGLFNNKELKDITKPRLLRFKEQSLCYNFKVRYMEGRKNVVADFLSRYP